MLNAHLLVVLGLALAAPALHAADNPMTSVQRSLKDLGFYFAEASGQVNEETRLALKRFQMRTGLQPTGEIDNETLQALSNATASAPPATAAESAPQSLRDRARRTDMSDREFLARVEAGDRGEVSAPRPVVPASPPAKAPPPPPPLRRAGAPPSDPAFARDEKAASFVLSYLKAAEAPRPDEEVSFYADHVDYFDSGRVSRQFVAQDQASYYRRWPNREFTLIGPLELIASKGSRVTVRFRLRYSVSNGRERASGTTETVVQLQEENERLKIISIHERKVGE